MSWQDRIKQAAYNSPSGDERIVFDYEDITKSVGKKTNAFEFPDVNGTYIQDLGNTGRRYPFRIIFWGDDHDLLSNQLENMLLENGIGILEHPVYGSIDVIPFGDINFKNDLKTETNQTVVEVTFWETIKLVYPIDQKNLTSEILDSVSKHNNDSAELFEDVLNLDSVIEKSVFKNEYTSLLDNVSLVMESVVSEQASIQKQFNVVNDSINNSIDILVSDPLTLAFQTNILIQLPARSSSAIADRLNAYNNLFQSVITGANSISASSSDSRNKNTFYTKDLYASTYITGSVISTIDTQFITKIDALLTAEKIINQMDDFIAWRDTNFASLSIVDTGESYQQLQNAVSLTVGFLIDLSFSLKQERRVILESPRTMVELIAELYPFETVIDDELDFFIQSNNLTGSEILELPRGRELVYYV
jgi:prophage DNA circulation protein